MTDLKKDRKEIDRLITLIDKPDANTYIALTSVRALIDALFWENEIERKHTNDILKENITLRKKLAIS